MTSIDNIMPNDTTHGPLVCNLIYDGLCTFEFALAQEAFGLARPELGAGWYRYRTTPIEKGVLRAAGGLTLVAQGHTNGFEKADLVIVPGWRGSEAAVPEATLRALVKAHARGARLASLCSGVFVLAATGLLDGKRVTTHWRYADALARKFPAIEVDPDVLYVDNGSLLTAAGTAAGIDLCLHIIRNDFGHDAANSVARRMVVAPHRDGGQAQFINAPVPKPHESTRMGTLLAALQLSLAKPHSIASLAERSGMSARTFQRRFTDMTGLAPLEWLTRARVSEARRLLEANPRIPLDVVAEKVGLGSAINLRHHFKSHLHLSPRAYRERFANLSDMASQSPTV